VKRLKIARLIVAAVSLAWMGLIIVSDFQHPDPEYFRKTVFWIPDIRSGLAYTYPQPGAYWGLFVNMYVPVSATMILAAAGLLITSLWSKIRPVEETALKPKSTKRKHKEATSPGSKSLLEGPPQIVVDNEKKTVQVEFSLKLPAKIVVKQAETEEEVSEKPPLHKAEREASWSKRGKKRKGGEK